MQGSGWKIVRNEFRQVERLRGMKCFPGGLCNSSATCIEFETAALDRSEFDRTQLSLLYNWPALSCDFSSAREA